MTEGKSALETGLGANRVKREKKRRANRNDDVVTYQPGKAEKANTVNWKAKRHPGLIGVKWIMTVFYGMHMEIMVASIGTFKRMGLDKVSEVDRGFSIFLLILGILLPIVGVTIVAWNLKKGKPIGLKFLISGLRFT